MKEGGGPPGRPFCFMCLDIVEFLIKQTSNTGINSIILLYRCTVNLDKNTLQLPTDALIY